MTRIVGTRHAEAFTESAARPHRDDMSFRTASDHPHPRTDPAPTPTGTSAATEIAAWRVILVGVLTLTVVLGQLYVVLPLLDSLVRLPGATDAATTTAVTSFALPYAVGILVLGPLTDRFGARPMMIASVLTVLVGTLLAAMSPSWGLFLLGRTVQGLAAAPFTPAVMLLIQRRVAPPQRLVATSAVIAAGMASAVVAQVYAQLALPVLGTSGVFAASAGALAVCATGIILLIPHQRAPLPERPVSAGVLDAYRAIPRLLLRPRLVLLLAAALSYLTVFVGMYAALQLTQEAQDAPRLLVLRASALPAIIAVPVCAPLLARISGRRRLLVSIAVAVLSTAAIGGLAFGGALSLPLFALGMAVTAGALAVAAPATITEVMAHATGAGGAANALYSSAIFGGASIGTPLAALMVSAVGGGSVGLGAFAVVSAGLLVIALLVAAVAVRPSARVK